MKRNSEKGKIIKRRKEEIIPVWERDSKEESKNGETGVVRHIVRVMIEAIILCLVATSVAFIIKDFLFGEIDYGYGLIDSIFFIELEENLQIVPDIGEVEKEKYDNLVRAYNDIKSALLNDSKLTIKMVRTYNRALREYENLDMDVYFYQIRFFGKYYFEGLKDGIKCEMYNNTINELNDAKRISEEEYNNFSNMYNEAWGDKDKIEKVMEYAEDLIYRVS